MIYIIPSVMVLESIAAGPYFTEKNPIPSANVFPTKNNKRPNGTSGSKYLICVNDTLRMYKNDDIRMYNFDCITDTIVEVITTCNTYTLLTVHLL